MALRLPWTTRSGYTRRELRNCDSSRRRLRSKWAVKCDASIPYGEVVGSLLWLADGSRPEISFTVYQVAKYCCDPRTAHWNACKKILHYLSSTQDYGILYSSVNADVTPKEMKNMPLPTAYFSLKRPRDADVSLESYMDDDFANCIDDRHMHPFLQEVLSAGSQGHSLP